MVILQHEWELEQLLRIVEEKAPRTVLEVGTFEGGTLQHWLSLKSTTNVVAVDNEMRNPKLWNQWAEVTDTGLHLIQGQSEDIAVIAAAAEYGPYDFLFIDADHVYEAAKLDWDSYSPMVSKGGLVAFHDLRPYANYGVHLVFEEINRQGYKTIAIQENRSDVGWGGIGIVFV